MALIREVTDIESRGEGRLPIAFTHKILNQRGVWKGEGESYGNFIFRYRSFATQSLPGVSLYVLVEIIIQFQPEALGLVDDELLVGRT